MNFKFMKMEGLANDFILSHHVPGRGESLLKQKVVELCDRRRGVGADGLILVLPSKKADVRMRIFNSDGSEAEMCGNGIRCLALYVKKTGLWKKPHLSVETLAGIIRTDINKESITVNMGAPILDASRIPIAKKSGSAIMEPIAIKGKNYAVTAISMGNPHAVVYSDELSDELVLGIGKKLESHSFFPKKANIEFVKVLSKNEIQMRVFERGCGETMACGTGACASAVSGILNQKNNNKVIVHLLGGDLCIEWDGNLSHPVYMTGPARFVYKGEIRIKKKERTS